MANDCAFELIANQKFDHLETRLSNVESHLERIENMINKMYIHIVGDQEFGHEGLIKRVQLLEKQNEKLMEYKNKLIGGSVVAGGIFTIIFEVLKTYVLK
jgi:hypothetical protein